MINKYVAMGFGALIALAPVAGLAQEQVAQATTDTSTSMARLRRKDIPARIAATFAARATPRGTARRASAHHHAPHADGSCRGAEELIGESRVRSGRLPFTIGSADRDCTRNKKFGNSLQEELQ